MLGTTNSSILIHQELSIFVYIDLANGISAQIQFFIEKGYLIKKIKYQNSHIYMSMTYLNYYGGEEKAFRILDTKPRKVIGIPGFVSRI